MKAFAILLLLFLTISCGNEAKVNQQKLIASKTAAAQKTATEKEPKEKVGNSNTIENLIQQSKVYADKLYFDLDYIRNKGLADKKYFAEFLGFYLKLNKVLEDEASRKEIQERIKPFYEVTKNADYHNMATVDDKLFKKNSMSYMRIMWLFKELGFDITYYKKEFQKVKKRMDDHMRIRGEWQRVVFDKYYDFFELEKPAILLKSKNLKGPISSQQPVSYYKRTNAYILTHFVFAAYDYGNALTQTKFDEKDLAYLSKILPPLVAEFEEQEDDDLVAELLTCMVFLKQTDDLFQDSYNRLLYRQNNDGSFGDYEKYRPKIGTDVEFRAYLHTTLVALEMFVEHQVRN
jgi:hypothetical protein